MVSKNKIDSTSGPTFIDRDCKFKINTKDGFVDPLESERVDQDFIVPSCDSKGHSVRVGFRQQEQYEKSIAYIIETHVFPYLTEADFIRHAIARHLLWCESIAKVKGHKALPSCFKQVGLMQEILVKNQLKLAFLEVFSSNIDTIRSHQQRANDSVNEGIKKSCNEEALLVLKKLRDHLAGFPKTSWRLEFEQILSMEFAEMLSKLPAQEPEPHICNCPDCPYCTDSPADPASNPMNASQSSTTKANVVWTFEGEEENEEVKPLLEVSKR